MKSSQSLKKIDGSKICLPVAFIPLSRTQTKAYNLQPLHLLLGLKYKYASIILFDVIYWHPKNLFSQ